MKYAIVLGTAQYDGRPSRILAGRLRHAGELATAEGLEVITVGGKLPGDRFTEAGVGRTFLREHFPHLTVHAVEEGMDTRSSLKAVKEAFALSDATIITDPLHRLRTALIARQEGLKATVSGTPYYPAARFSAWSGCCARIRSCGIRRLSRKIGILFPGDKKHRMIFFKLPMHF